MGSRQTWFCDWCEVETEDERVVNRDWSFVTGSEMLCPPCVTEREAAIAAAKARRRRAE